MWGSYNGIIISQQEAEVLSQRLPFYSGRSLIETMRWQGKQLFLATYHWQRLFAGMKTLDYRAPSDFTPAFLEQQIELVLSMHAGAGDLKVRLQVAPADAPDHPPAFLINTAPLPATCESVQAGIAQNVYKQPHFLCHLKTGDRQLYALAALTAAHYGWDEALICNEAGRVIESTIANIFWVEKDQLFTPPLSEGCVAGVMRAFLLKSLPAAGYKLYEEPLTVDRLGKAKEVFLANALRGLRPVAEIAGIRQYHSNLCPQISNLLFSA